MRSGTGIAMRRWMPLVALVAANVCGPLGVMPPALASTGEVAAKPNVIWILLDACRPDHLSCYGYERKTSPAIDALAARGVTFDRNCAQANVTLLSVPSFLTGRYFPVCTFAPIHWEAESRVRPPYEEYISETFKRNGYKTAIITAHPGITPVGRLREAFDLYQWPKGDPGESYAEFDTLNQTILPWLEQFKDTPFFLYVHSLDTHAPHYVHDGHDMWVDRSKSNAFVVDSQQGEREQVAVSTETGRSYVRGAYDGSIHFADAHVGAIVDKLSALGILDQTIFVITADHGELLGEDGETLQHPNSITAQELMRVPLIMAGPGLPKGVPVTRLTQNVDIAPSLVDLLGLESRARYDGRSFMSLVKDASAPPIHEEVLFKSPYGYYNEDDRPILALHNGQYTWEINPHTGIEHLWQMPDHLSRRTDVIESRPQVAATLKAKLDEQILPLWEQYAQLPQTAVNTFVLYIVEAIEKGRVTPEGAWVDADDPADGKWTLSGRDLFAYPWSEDPPPLEMFFHLPNGRYEVQLSLLRGDKEHHPASAVRLKAQGEPAFRRVQPDPQDRAKVPSGQTELGYIDVGVFSVVDGRFVVVLDVADTAYFASARAFRFTRTGDVAPETTLKEREELEEKLRGLGYLE